MKTKSKWKYSTKRHRRQPEGEHQQSAQAARRSLSALAKVLKFAQEVEEKAWRKALDSCDRGQGIDPLAAGTSLGAAKVRAYVADLMMEEPKGNTEGQRTGS